jgi:hypothetical protein
MCTKICWRYETWYNCATCSCRWNYTFSSYFISKSYWTRAKQSLFDKEIEECYQVNAYIVELLYQKLIMMSHSTKSRSTLSWNHASRVLIMNSFKWINTNTHDELLALWKNIRVDADYILPGFTFVSSWCIFVLMRHLEFTSVITIKNTIRRYVRVFLVQWNFPSRTGVIKFSLG